MLASQVCIKPNPVVGRCDSRHNVVPSSIQLEEEPLSLVQLRQFGGCDAYISVVLKSIPRQVRSHSTHICTAANRKPVRTKVARIRSRRRDCTCVLRSPRAVCTTVTNDPKPADVRLECIAALCPHANMDRSEVRKRNRLLTS
jgi:hypothetical protein